jgi:aldehyde:ferredoxin oxidoreductase
MKKTRNAGPAADHLPPIKELVSDYYRARGWNAKGEIEKQKLEALGLKEL